VSLLAAPTKEEPWLTRNSYRPVTHSIVQLEQRSALRLRYVLVILRRRRQWPSRWPAYQPLHDCGLNRAIKVPRALRSPLHSLKD
jgi:hypothetical protein